MSTTEHPTPGNGGQRPGLRSATRPGPQRSRSPAKSASSHEMLDLAMAELTLESIQKQPKQVGMVYDERMLETHHIWRPDFPERPDRLKLSYEKCVKYGLVDRCLRVPAREATEAEILYGHSKEYFELVRSSADMNEEQLKELSMKYDAVYFHPATYNSAMLAAGSAIELTEQVVKDKLRYGMALVRPPGHHAMRKEGCGYCIFNNAALAAKHAVDRLGLERVLLVDWDLHHGQGSQFMFYDDPRVLYFSIHRYEHGRFWPNLRESDYDHIGNGKGRGYNVNVPFNQVDMTDGDYMSIMHQILLPLAYEYNPQLVIVSCGFDAAIGDAEGRSEVSPACYAHFTHLMKQVASDHLCILFEGGYCLKSLAEGVALTLRALLDDPLPLLPPLSPPMDSTRESILQVIRVLRPYWKCFLYQDDVETQDDLSPMFRNIVIPQPDVVFFTDSNRPEKFELNYEVESYTNEERKKLDQKIDLLIEQTTLYTPPNRTCVVYDERMCEHKSTTCLDHPERPSRIKRIHSSLKDIGLLSRCKSVEARFATDEELELVHRREWIATLRELQSSGSDDQALLERRYNSIYLSQTVFDCASLAVGSTLNVIDEVLSGSSRSGLAIVRPPGHHAETDCAMGFCFFNTVAIAAKYAQKRHQIKRILILDWDVHHGNGIQNTFIDEASVLYISIHRRDGGSFFPAGDANDLDKVGRGSGTGFNINIPWPRGGMGDAEYLAAFQQIVMPVAYEFSPDLVLVSAGFDAALGDPLGNCRITPVGYGHMTHMLNGLAGGRIIIVLEGGYNLNSISESMSMCASVLLGDRLPLLHTSSPKQAAVDIIKEVIQVHSQYWKSLAYHVSMPSRKETLVWLGDVPQQQEQQLQQKSDISSSSSTADVDSLSSALAASHITDVTAQGNSRSKADGDEAAAAEFTDDEPMGLQAVVPLLWCPHLPVVQPVPDTGLDTSRSCDVCGSIGENWVCLSCYQVCCSRYQNAHMVAHNAQTHHPLCLSYFDLSVWCYTCQAYVHNEAFHEAKNAAHLHKFGVDA